MNSIHMKKTNLMCRDFVLQKSHYEIGYKIWNLKTSSRPSQKSFKWSSITKFIRKKE